MLGPEMSNLVWKIFRLNSLTSDDSKTKRCQSVVKESAQNIGELSFMGWLAQNELFP